MGLSTNDIDALLNIAETKEGGVVNYTDFISKITPGDLEALIV